MIHDALVFWTPEAIRGKRELPPTLRYVGLSRFAGDVIGRDTAWSVELLFETPPPEQSGDVSRAQVRFLFDDAPHERLHQGVTFSLYEGPVHVGEVMVL